MGAFSAHESLRCRGSRQLVHRLGRSPSRSEMQLLRSNETAIRGMSVPLSVADAKKILFYQQDRFALRISPNVDDDLARSLRCCVTLIRDE